MSIRHVVQKSNKLKLRPPSNYWVILHNDDYTTMDFVIEVLMRFFDHTQESAEEIMLSVHHQGKGICGEYSAEIAETKVMQVRHYAQLNQFPLRCTMEKSSS